MDHAELGYPNRQFTITAQALVENLYMARTVHRLDRIVTLINMSGEHVVTKLVPVT